MKLRKLSESIHALECVEMDCMNKMLKGRTIDRQAGWLDSTEKDVSSIISNFNLTQKPLTLREGLVNFHLIIAFMQGAQPSRISSASFTRWQLYLATLTFCKDLRTYARIVIPSCISGVVLLRPG